jgi:hypothetical protein
VEQDTRPFTGGLAPNRFEKPLGMRRKPFKSDLSYHDPNVDLTVLGLRRSAIISQANASSQRVLGNRSSVSPWVCIDRTIEDDRFTMGGSICDRGTDCEARR